MTKKLFASLLLVGFAAFGLSACDNTIRGVGQDIEDSADAVEDSVN